MQVTEKQPSKVLLPNTSQVQDIAKPIPNYRTPQVKPRGDTSTKMIDRNTIQDVGKEISIYLYPVYRPSNKPVKHLCPMFLEAYEILTQD